MNHDDWPRREFHAVIAVENRVKQFMLSNQLSRCSVDQISGAGEQRRQRKRRKEAVHAVTEVKHAFVVSLKHFDVGGM